MLSKPALRVWVSKGNTFRYVLSFAPNIGPGWMGMPLRNTPANSFGTSVNEEKSFMLLTACINLRTFSPHRSLMFGHGYIFQVSLLFASVSLLEWQIIR
jgi:hypothetical protein